jgi:sec-independent protein translocase protein TatA
MVWLLRKTLDNLEEGEHSMFSRPPGPLELILILVIVIIVFGVGRLPELGGAVGKAIREFREATGQDKVETAETKKAAEAAPEEEEKKAS